MDTGLSVFHAQPPSFLPTSSPHCRALLQAILTSIEQRGFQVKRGVGGVRDQPQIPAPTLFKCSPSSSALGVGQALCPLLLFPRDTG